MMAIWNQEFLTLLVAAMVTTTIKNLLVSCRLISVHKVFKALRTLCCKYTSLLLILGIPSGGGECPYCQKWIQTSVRGIFVGKYELSSAVVPISNCSKFSSKVKRHVEDKHLPRATPCTVCSKVGLSLFSGNHLFCLVPEPNVKMIVQVFEMVHRIVPRGNLCHPGVQFRKQDARAPFLCSPPAARTSPSSPAHNS